MSWNEQKENKLRELWKKGHSASQIAEMLGNTTRNAVIGKANRLKLEARAVSRKFSSKEKTDNANNEIKKKKLSKKGKFKALLLDKSFEPEKPTKLEDLNDETCKWPLGDKFLPAEFFCGRKPLEKFPYCKLHILYAFQPKNAKEEDIITDEDVPKYIEKKNKSA
jgi:GcrA cell cycle regulator